MSTEGIISIIITLIIGIPSLITFFRINQTKIIHLEKHLINLKDDLLKNFDDLSIKYKGVEIQKNIYFISGFLICQGKKDISNENNDIEISIPENWKWLEYKIVSNSKGLNFQKKLKKNKVSLNFDLLKNKEFFEYEGIIEINEEIKKENVSDKFDFHHRIPNIPEIKSFSIETLKSGLSILTSSLALIIFPLFATYDYNSISKYDIETYNAVNDEKLNSTTVYNNKEIGELEEQIAQESSGIVLFLKGKTKDYSVNTFDYYGNKNTSLTSVYFKMHDWSILGWIFCIFLSLLLFLGVLGIIVSIRLFYYQKRYLKLIGN